MSNLPHDPLSDLPDPVIFYDKHGNPTGKTMSKAEIREKDLVLTYYGGDMPAGVVPGAEHRREVEEFLANGCMMPWQRRLQQLRQKEQERKTSAMTP